MPSSPQLNAFFEAYGPAAEDIRRALEDAAEEAERLIKKHRAQRSKKGRLEAARLALILKGIRQQQATLWGTITPALRSGIARASMAAATAERTFDVYLRELGVDLPALQASFRTQATRGAELAYRQATAGIPLSRQVYRTRALATGQVERVIRRGLVLGLDEQALANSVRNLIDPKVRGGVSYAAMRLARTEMNNAFHAAAIARFDEPWAVGVRWHLSGSHSPTGKVPPERCEVLAAADNGLGVGVWPTDGVPAKPHPLCMCYLTQVTVSEEEFTRRFLAGEYDDFMREQIRRYAPASDPLTKWLNEQPKGTSKQTLIRRATAKFGVSPQAAALAVQAHRSDSPALPRKRTPRTIDTPPEIPDVVATPDPPAPSQTGDVVAAHIGRINEFGSVHRARVDRALTRQASFSPRSMLRLNRVTEMTREAPSYGQPGVTGEYDERRQILFLDASAFQAGAEDTFRRERDTNFIARCGEQFDSLDALIAHEYGHHAHDQWMLGAPESVVRDTWRQLAKAVGLPPPSRFDEQSVNNWVLRNKQYFENMVSRYGGSSVVEMLAETWSEFTLGDPPRPHIQAMGEILQKATEAHS